MRKGVEAVWRLTTNALLALMCFVSFGIMYGLATTAGAAGRQVVLRFVVVAAVPVIWIAVVGLFRRRGLNAAVAFGLTAAMLIAFVGAIDFANGRPLYEWVGQLLS